MDFSTDIGFPINPLIERRWSPRAFTSEGVDSAAIGALLEAARWAPSCYNEQPWAFLVGTREDPEVFARMLGCLVEFNQNWARHAPVLMFSIAHHHFVKNGQANRWAFHDVGAAAENMAIQATALGLTMHSMGGFSPDKVREHFGLPSDWEAVAAIAIGYANEPAPPRTRKPIESFAFRGHWGNPWR